MCCCFFISVISLNFFLAKVPLVFVPPPFLSLIIHTSYTLPDRLVFWHLVDGEEGSVRMKDSGTIPTAQNSIPIMFFHAHCTFCTSKSVTKMYAHRCKGTKRKGKECGHRAKIRRWCLPSPVPRSILVTQVTSTTSWRVRRQHEKPSPCA